MRKIASLLVVLVFALFAVATQRVRPEADAAPAGPIDNPSLAATADLAQASALLDHPPPGCTPMKVGLPDTRAVVSTAGDITVTLSCTEGTRVVVIKDGKMTVLK